MTSSERKQLVIYRINKAKETFNEIDVLIQNKLWNTAINRCIMPVIMLKGISSASAFQHRNKRKIRESFFF
jgi:hypothetical protein